MIGRLNLNLEIVVMNDVVDLESFIKHYMKRQKFEKSSKLLARVIPERNFETNASRTMEKFKTYLMKLEKRIVDDDLGFEINFGAGPTSVKVTAIFIISNQFRITIFGSIR